MRKQLALFLALPFYWCGVSHGYRHDIAEGIRHLITEEGGQVFQVKDIKEHEASMEWPCLDAGVPTMPEIAAMAKRKLQSVIEGVQGAVRHLLTQGFSSSFFMQSREDQQKLAAQSAESIKALLTRAAGNAVSEDLRNGPNTVLVGLSASVSERFSRAVPHIAGKFRNASGVGLTLWFDPKTLSVLAEAEGTWNFVEAAPSKPSSPFSFEGAIAAKLTTDSSVGELATKAVCGPALLLGYSIMTSHGALGISVSLGLNDRYQIDDVSFGFTLGTNDGFLAGFGYSAAQGLIVQRLEPSYEEVIADMIKNDPPLRHIEHASDSDSFEADQKRVRELTNWDLMRQFFTG